MFQIQTKKNAFLFTSKFKFCFTCMILDIACNLKGADKVRNLFEKIHFISSINLIVHIFYILCYENS